MGKFLPGDAFQGPAEGVRLLPIRFERIGENRFLVSNVVGDFEFLDDAVARQSG
jgi:hypothetical protein